MRLSLKMLLLSMIIFSFNIQAHSITSLVRTCLNGEDELLPNQVLQDFQEKFLENAVEKLDVGGSKNLGIYAQGDFLVKVTNVNRAVGEATLKKINETIKYNGLTNVYSPIARLNIDIPSESGNKPIVAHLVKKAPGKELSKLSSAEMSQISDVHWGKFEADTRRLADLGIVTDFTKLDNFFYDPTAGFSFIDIGEWRQPPIKKFFNDESGNAKFMLYDRFNLNIGTATFDSFTSLKDFIFIKLHFPQTLEATEID